ncbi:MAG: hypothetical protein JSV44_02635 [Candidatus Zixiibacteriota bacterium]|nr:MAG: hypothetical protein JSV44_02635 [candidate division Zixibacteria bacterium]
MEKELGQIRFTKLDDGIRIEMTGERFKDLGECCLPMIGGGKFRVASCEPAEDCCEPGKEKK